MDSHQVSALIESALRPVEAQTKAAFSKGGDVLALIESSMRPDETFTYSLIGIPGKSPFQPYLLLCSEKRIAAIGITRYGGKNEFMTFPFRELKSVSLKRTDLTVTWKSGDSLTFSYVDPVRAENFKEIVADTLSD